MIQFLKRCLLIYCQFLCFFIQEAYSKEILPLRFDSAAVKTITPSAKDEKEVFSQVDLKFVKEKENSDMGVWDRFIDWLLNLFFGKADYETKASLQKIVIWIFIIAGIAVIIWLLTRTEFTAFLKGETKQTEFSFSDMDEDISAINFNDRIDKAIADKDYRLGIRWLYVKQLYLLNQKNAITWQPYKTNIDYMQEIAKHPYQQAFTSISRIYDYVWYGQYQVTAESFFKYAEEFKQFEKQIGV